MEHAVLDEHVQVHVDQVTVEHIVVLSLINFIMQGAEQHAKTLEGLLVVVAVVQVFFVGLQLVFGKLFEVC